MKVNIGDGQQLNFASFGVDDPVGHRLDTWGVGGCVQCYLPSMA
ncbi:MAG TPA: hypothetical protein VF831_09535 [Anaerolineales bacterium]